MAEEGASSSSLAPRTLGGFFVALKQTALTKAARFYVYGSGRVSKKTFDDPSSERCCKGISLPAVAKGNAPF